MNVWFLNLISWHLQGIIFARQILQSTSPLLDIGNGNWNVLILRQCHVVEFVSYVSQSVQDIYFYSCQSTCTFVCTQLTENTKCVPNCFLFFFYGYVCSPSWQSLHVPILYLQNTCFCNSFWLVATFTSCIQLETDIHLVTTEIWLALQRVERREGESNPWLAKMKWYVCSNVHYVIKFVSDLRQVSGFLRILRFPPPIKLTATI
jgi:hypothetical protein